MQLASLRNYESLEMNFNHKTYHIQQPAQRRQGQYGDVSGVAVERRV